MARSFLSQIIASVLPRTGTTTSTGTLTVNSDAVDFYSITAQAAGLTIANPTGTPSDGQTLIIRVKDNGTARSIGFGANFRGSTDVTLPTTTTVNKHLYMRFYYNSADSKWDLLAKNDGF